MEPLERQSKAAREYLQLKEELKVCDANQFLLEAEHIQSQLNEISRKKQVLEGDLEETRKKVRTSERNMTAWKQKSAVWRKLF